MSLSFKRKILAFVTTLMYPEDVTLNVIRQ